MIDQVRLFIKAGDGGNGKVSFRREKFIPKGGPDGGDGGKGGSIYIKSNSNLKTLNLYAGKKKFKAKNGHPGGKAKKHGKDSPDIILQVPPGTVVINKVNNKEVVDLDLPEKHFLLAKGGRGGRGNWHFKSSTNTTPRFAEKGKNGESREIILNLKIIAQIGLIGLPNAGKSTLLSVLTRAKPKISDYPFTTLSPNLGVMEHSDKKDGLVIADIPGLIEGASRGKGLGIKFLKHIERCEFLVYVLYPKNDDLDKKDKDLIKSLVQQKKQVVTEIKTFNPHLLKLPSLTVINKIDLLEDGKRKEIKKSLKKEFKNLILISAATNENIDILKNYLRKQNL